jgi:hypothetical protein
VIIGAQRTPIFSLSDPFYYMFISVAEDSDLVAVFRQRTFQGCQGRISSPFVGIITNTYKRGDRPTKFITTGIREKQVQSNWFNKGSSWYIFDIFEITMIRAYRPVRWASSVRL